MQAETTRLIIHTGAGPRAARDTERHAGQRKARPARVKAGEVVVWGFAPGAEAAKGGRARRSERHRAEPSAPDRARKARMFPRRRAGENTGVEKRPADAAATGTAAAGPSNIKAHAGAWEGHAETAGAQRSAHARKGVAHGLRKSRRRPAKTRLTFGERLLRNSAVACALLLALLAARNIDTPWTRAAVEGVERALTMKIDLDSSLGSLSFVRDLMPESMLVFFDLSTAGELAQPVEGTLEKRFDEQQPWVEFACEPGAVVTAAEAGTVVATTQLSGGGWGVMIEHDNGLESVCAYLLEPEVSAGERVERGQAIAGSEAGRVYFEVRREGEIIDPAPLLGA